MTLVAEEAPTSLGGFVAILCCAAIFLVIALWPVVLLFVGYSRRKRILAELDVREAALRGLLTTTTSEFGPARATFLVTGSAVYAADAPAALIAQWHNVIGGSIESLRMQTEIARRLATVRALEQARAAGAKAVVNLRYQSAEIGSTQGQGNSQRGKAIVEMLAYGTAWIPAE